MGLICISNASVTYMFLKAIKLAGFFCFGIAWITLKSTFQTVFVPIPPAAAAVLWELHAYFPCFSTLLWCFLLPVPMNSHACPILPHACFHYHNLQVIDKTDFVKGQQTCGLGEHSFRSVPTCEQLLRTGNDLTAVGHGLGTTRLPLTCLWTVN